MLNNSYGHKNYAKDMKQPKTINTDAPGTKEYSKPIEFNAKGTVKMANCKKY